MNENPNPKWTERQRKKLLARIVGPETTPERIGQMIIFMIIGALVYILLLGDYGVFRIRSLQDEISRQQQEIRHWQAVHDSLQHERWRLINDPDYIEKIAREKYGMQGDDETVYKFYDENATADDTTD